MGLIDSHCHLTDEAFDGDRDFIIKDLGNFKVDYIINPGTNLADSKKALDLAHKFDRVFAQVGIHPEDVDSMGEGDLKEIEGMAKDPRVLAIGEIGLDYHFRDDNKDRQKEVFISQLKMARRLGKPCVIHTRDVGMDAYEILKDFKDLKVQIHCFQEDERMLKLYLDLGFYISIGGVVTFKNGLNEKRAAGLCPMDRLMVETDSPYLSPEPFRGLRNDPRRIMEVARVIAGIRGVKLSRVIKGTSRSAREFFDF
ncbi:MAG: TatD family hydrolase [Anaerococcus sp.]|nr:TatD family hydrolase [Anaerococcus sp.]